MLQRLLPYLVLFSLCACGPKRDAQQTGRPVPPPDESTSEQREATAATLDRIEELTRDLGRPHTFRRLPIIVTTDNRTYTDHPAACVSWGGKGQFILVKPSVFEAEEALSASQIETTLFRVLLHEIGHCYFGREHEDAHLSSAGNLIDLTIQRGDTPLEFRYNFLDATVMVPENLTLPIPLERYYVSEILGIARAKTASELGAFAKIRLVKKEELAVQP